MSDPEIMQEIQKAYNKNFIGKNWPHLELEAVEYKSNCNLLPTSTEKLVKENQKFDGWVRYRSALWSSMDGWHQGTDKSDHGSPLAAEWVIDTNTSMHLCADPVKPGNFVTWTYKARACADANAQQNEILALRQEIIVLAHPIPNEPKKGKDVSALIYHVYWGADKDDPSAIRRLFSRFAGFTKRCDRVIARESR